MMKQSDEFVVHCKSQEEWDAVLEYYGAKGTFPTFDIHSRNCLRTPYTTRRGDKFSLGFADLKFFEHHLIISFEEFSKRFLNKKEDINNMSNTEVKTAPFKSDGGSSDYYKIVLTNKAGDSIEVEMGDIIRQAFGNDFDLGNIVKACRRISEAKQGRGKAGVDVEYDANKIIYFANEVKAWHGKL